jgi:hypothetical protein
MPALAQPALPLNEAVNEATERGRATLGLQFYYSIS